MVLKADGDGVLHQVVLKADGADHKVALVHGALHHMVMHGVVQEAANYLN